MLNRLVTTILGFPKYLARHPQFAFSILLILIIPIAFLYTGQQFLKVASENQERLEKDKIGIMHDVFAELVVQNTTNPQILQQKIEAIVRQNPDLQKFRVVKESSDGLYVLAALRSDVVGTYESATDLYNFSSIEKNDSLIFEYYTGETRLWQAFRSIEAPDGSTYYIFTETSFALTDQLFAHRITIAYGWLAGVLLIVMFLAYRHLRLIDYGYLYRESQHAIATRDLFTNMVTHELRAPLTAIRGYASMIHENTAVEFSVREQALKIEQSSARLLLIVNDLLEVARLQSGRLQIEKTDVDVCKVIKQTVNELEETARDKAIALSTDLQSNQCSVFTDSKRLAQIITNLVNNAIKYTEAGAISVVLKVHPSEIEIRVQDTGMGISSEDQKKLFAPFFRVESKDVSKITGSGLGMWITKQLVTLLDGDIGVESIKNVGTHVVLKLPKS